MLYFYSRDAVFIKTPLVYVFSFNAIISLYRNIIIVFVSKRYALTSKLQIKSVNIYLNVLVEIFAIVSFLTDN